MPNIIKVTAAILEQDGRLIIAQRKSSDYLSGLWDFPGGKIEPGESPEQHTKEENK
jgi:8-oxo-dGTP diphosphatase